MYRNHIENDKSGKLSRTLNAYENALNNLRDIRAASTLDGFTKNLSMVNLK